MRRGERSGGEAAGALPGAAGADPQLVGRLLSEELHDERWRDPQVVLIAGGRSNLTYSVRSEAGELILRRPPLGGILPTAHDMTREYRVLSALHGSAVPVPRTLHLWDADAGLGVAFYAMERVLGHVCRERLPVGYAAGAQQRAAVGEALIAVLAALHTLDPRELGLADFGRPQGFMERQLRRWSEQWERSRTQAHPALEKLRAALAARVPAPARAALLHGDYRLDNTVLHASRPGEIVAVLDWEMSTLGDPLADLGTLLAYWSESGDDELRVRARVFPAVTAQPGFPRRDQLIEAYARRTGLDVSGLAWYEAFAFFKLAVICQGVLARAAGGAMPAADAQPDQGLVDALVALGERQLQRAACAN